ncbi:uncharacterized protein LOC108715416 [Xenopus laevis]|uniref:Uncharacterized protein LOC108715416 n=1 Tax=Xenopus laevis TaxID=8355 RepID=A0A8J1KIA4_XENLA|nr:uncharacterized protein LOC108715416 [Xenopus laevis]XP_041417085.1 uncharacterized protein LOC108715416 [Xenopus laevis]
MFKFLRSIKLKMLYMDKNTGIWPKGRKDIVSSKLKTRSTFNPNFSCASIDTFSNMINSDIEKGLHKHVVPKVNNLHLKEKNALINLQKDKGLIIKKADKGGSIVVMNKEDYLKEAHRQLNNTEHYKPLNNDPTERLKTDIDMFLEDACLTGVISPEIQELLRKDNPRVPIFYLLPKVHKTLINPPGRPIVSGVNSLLQPLAIYIDTYLQEILPKLDTCLSDTTQFLKTIEGFTVGPHSTILCTIDVKDLYTSIPHDEGIECTREYLSRENLPTHEINFLCDCLELVLKRNYFRFDSDYFLQAQGTSMGANMAPAYANIFMHRIEHEHILHNPKFKEHIALWKRYVDDMFLIWTGSPEILTEFFTYLNTIHDTIKFTTCIGPNSVNYLDVQVTSSDGSLTTDLYKKPTDRNNMLRKDSFHPIGTIKGLPKSQFIRARRITSSETLYNKQGEELVSRFVQRGFSKTDLDKTMDEVGRMKREDLMVRKTPTQKKLGIPCVTTYGPHSSFLKRTINKHWSILQNDKTYGKLFLNNPLFSYKRGKSIGDQLTKTDIKRHKYKKPVSERVGTFPCLNCGHCSGVIKGDVCTHPSKGFPIGLKCFATCNTEGVIYLLKCPCGLGYVGQTSRLCRVRLNEHKSVIRNFVPEMEGCDPAISKKKDRIKKETLLAKHFYVQKHTVSQLRWQILEKITAPQGNEMKLALLKREAFWIWKLETVQPKGLNENFSLSCFL